MTMLTSNGGSVIDEGRNPHIVVVGGGSGSSVLLRGLRPMPAESTAIVTMFDSGGSTGALKSEFGYPAFGDLRQCLLALANQNSDIDSLREALEFRFGKETSLQGHSVGNLLLAALTSVNGDLEDAIDLVGRLLDIRGQVIPVTLDSAELCAELADGTVIRGETHIDLRDQDLPGIGRVFLDRAVRPNPRAIEAIMNADAIVLGPGDLFTSIVPNLLVNGVREAIAASPAQVIYVCNLMTKRGETDGYTAGDFAEVISRHLHKRGLDWVIVNTRHIAPRALDRYAMSGAFPVCADDPSLDRYARHTLATPLSSDEEKVRHDPERLAEAILSIFSMVKDQARGSVPFLDRLVGTEKFTAGKS